MAENEVTTDTKPTSAEDEFDKAFQDALDGKPLAQEDQLGAKPQDTDDDEQAADELESSAAADDSIFNQPPASDGPSSGEDQQTAQPDVQALQQQITDLQAENRKLANDMAAWKGRIKAANDRANVAEAKVKELESAAPATGTQPDAGTDNPELGEFVKEYPELEKPIRLLAEQVADKIVKERLGSVETTVQTVQQSVNQIQESTSDAATQAHLDQITKAHPDWKAIHESGKLKAWIEAQPTFLQDGLNRVVSDGETQEVIDLFTQYKKSTSGRTTNTKPTSQTSNAAAGLEAVPASSGGPPPQPKKVDKGDFDGAWDEANTKGK